MAITEQDLLELLQREKARNSGTAQPAARPQPVSRQAQFAQQLKGVGTIPAMSKDAYLNELIADQLNQGLNQGLNTGITPIVGGPVVATPADLQRPASKPTTQQIAQQLRTAGYSEGDVMCGVAAAISHDDVELELPRPRARTVALPGPATSGTAALQAGQRHSVRELEQLWAGPGEDLETELPEAQQFQGNDSVLASLWDSTVPEGAQQEGGYQPDPQVFRQEVMGTWDPADVQFEGSDEIQFNDEGPGISREGRERTRFRVDRQDPPPRRPIDRHATPVGGQVVSQRGSDGRFQAVQRPTPPHPRDAVELWDHGPGGPRPPRQPKRTVPVAIDRSNIPTAWDRVMGDDDF